MLSHELSRTIHAERERQIAAHLRDLGLRSDRAPVRRTGRGNRKG